MAGIKHGAQRPKLTKGLKERTKKHFRNDNPRLREEYRLKMEMRAARRSGNRKAARKMRRRMLKARDSA